MKKLVFTLILAFQVFVSFPQADSLSALHNVFAPLSRSRIPYGILSDYGVQLVSFAPFNGVLTDSSYTTFDVWQMLYAGLNSSVIDTTITFEGVNPVVTRLKAKFKADSTTVFIPIINYGYASLNPNAYTQGLISVVSEQLYDIAGKNPYTTNTLFATAPSLTYAEGSSVKFCLRSDMYLSNLSKTFSSVYVDFGNGNGYTRVYFGTPYSATYTASDTVTVRVKVTLSDATVLYSHFRMYIEVPSSDKYNEWDIQTIQLPKISGVHSGGTLSWVLSDSNKTGRIRKPLIVAEGFDPLAILFKTNASIKDFLNSTKKVKPTGSSLTFNKELDYSGYDIVFLDYKNGVDDIFRNAKLLEQAIDSVNRWKKGVAGAEQNVVMGNSMGGLVAKTALVNMEAAGKSHDTRLFISMDSPHK
ncbi:MAG TPA: hypothetical protein PLE97_11020, partial [Tenuifilaceae bacterium]|nr:hypothetical protein [Tenuifilaceae bacterium]